VNYDILKRTERKHCLCTGMLYDPAWKTGDNGTTFQPTISKHSLQVYSRWFRFKQYVLLRLKDIKKENKNVRPAKRFKAGINIKLFK